MALQIAIVLAYAGSREWTARHGREVVLATRPVDPRDLFRGDYVTLNYKISQVDDCWRGREGGDLYVPLSLVGDDWEAGAPAPTYAEAASRGDVVIKGTVSRVTQTRCQMVYGIETYYVQEGTGDNIERLRGQLRVRVTIDQFGNAMIKDLVRPG